MLKAEQNDTRTRYDVVRLVEGKAPIVWLAGFVDREVAQMYATESNRFTRWMNDGALYEVREQEASK